MSDAKTDYASLTAKARVEAAKRMGGRPVGIYGVDDIAQEVLMRFIRIEATETIEKPEALLSDLAFKSFSNAVKREKRRRIEHPDFEQIADDCIVVQHWERDEIIDEQVEALHRFAKNDVQRGIVLHARLGIANTDPLGKTLLKSCLGVSGGSVAVQKSRLISDARTQLAAGEPRTAVVTTPGTRSCACPVLRLQAEWQERQLREAIQRDRPVVNVFDLGGQKVELRHALMGLPDLRWESLERMLRYFKEEGFLEHLVIWLRTLEPGGKVSAHPLLVALTEHRKSLRLTQLPQGSLREEETMFQAEILKAVVLCHSEDYFERYDPSVLADIIRITNSGQDLLTPEQRRDIWS